MSIETKYFICQGCDMISKAKTQISANIFSFKEIYKRTKISEKYLKSEELLRVHIF